jgi:hypothetical protein
MRHEKTVSKKYKQYRNIIPKNESYQKKISCHNKNICAKLISYTCQKMENGKYCKEECCSEWIQDTHDFCMKHDPMIEVYFDTLLDIIQQSVEKCSMDLFDFKLSDTILLFMFLSNYLLDQEWRTEFLSIVSYLRFYYIQRNHDFNNNYLHNSETNYRKNLEKYKTLLYEHLTQLRK